MIIFGTAFVLMLGFRGVQELTSSNPLPTPTETGVISIGSMELFDAYEKDAATADKEYLGRVLEVTGEVTLSKGFFETYYIVLAGQGTDIFQLGVRCVFGGETEPIDPKLYEVQKHETVTIQGICHGLQSDVLLKQCRLVKY